MNLNQILSILAARWWVALSVAVATVLATTVITLLLPKSYTASTSVVLEAKLTDVLGSANSAAAILPQVYVATQLDVMQSNRVASKVVSMLGLAANPTALKQFQDDTKGQGGSIEDYYAALLLKRLDLKPSRDSNVVTMNFSANDPRFAAQVSDAFAKAYIETTLELRTGPARQYASWFNEQLKTLRADVERTQTRLSAFQQRHGIVGNDERFDIEGARLAELSSQLAAAQGQALDAKSRSALGAPELTSVPDVAATPVMTALRGELLRSEAKLEEMAQHFGPAHPSMERQQGEVDSLRAKLAAELRNASGTVSSVSRQTSRREVELRGALAAQKKRVLDIKRDRDEMAALVREAEHAQRLYDLALQRFSQNTLESLATQGGAFVLSPAAVPSSPSSPRTQLNIILSAILGVLLGLGAALLTELLDRRVRSGADVTRELQLPVLGAVPAAGRRWPTWLSRWTPRSSLAGVAVGAGQ